MGAAQIIIVAGSFVLASVGMVGAMRRALRREAEHMHRRRQAWIEAGSPPDQEPRFGVGNGSSGTM